jgi:hypothetical protein
VLVFICFSLQSKTDKLYYKHIISFSYSPPASDKLLHCRCVFDRLTFENTLISICVPAPPSVRSIVTFNPNLETEKCKLR